MSKVDRYMMNFKGGKGVSFIFKESGKEGIGDARKWEMGTN